MAQAPLFLERRSYRKRRLMDAVRLLPLLGLALWMVPVLWGVPGVDGQDAGIAMSSALRYVFGVWMMMVLGGWLLWLRTRSAKDTEDGLAQHAPNGNA